ncbi:MAG: hypothetical protein E6I87_09265 [Chloroflexi bacterium]|nr:MAG: hypothetical protein E6I87_09265 [Chloroflexota bacterium]
MQRVVSLLATLAITLAPAAVAGAFVVEPATSNTTVAAPVAKTAAKTTTSVTTSAVATTGNGAPSGAHYNLNLIGVPKQKSADMTGSNGHVIFVSLVGNTKINLSLGDFQVLDANGTDGTAAFQLPNPDPDGDGVTAYSVYARALGKPNGSAVATSCTTDALGVTYCSTESVVLVRGSGRQKFDNVSRQLLTVCLDTTGDGVCDVRQSLFADPTASYLWSYDNNGLKLAQLRFYELPSVVGTTP